jgi:type IV secretory pathway TraG/TraD family ATPase VirD4
MAHAIVGFIFVIFLLSAMSKAGKTRKYNDAVKAAETFDKPNAFGRGKWADNGALRKAGLFKGGGLHFGFSPDGKRKLRYQKSGHVLVVAAARMGKLLTVIGGLIMSLDRKYSLLLMDPKGELTCVVAKIRSRIGKVYVWNPYGLQLKYLDGVNAQASYNPFADISLQKNCVSDMKALLKTFWTATADFNDPHWIPNGWNTAVGVAVALKELGKPHEQNLPMLRTILAGPFFAFCQTAVREGSPFVRETLGRYAEPGAEKNKELEGFRSVAMTETEWLSEPEFARSLKRADFSMRDAKRKAGMTISCVLPVHRLADGKAGALFSGWFLHCCLDEGQNGRRVPCVAVIDEMSQMVGYSKAWMDAFALGAGAAGLQIVAIYQDVAQIRNQFGKAWSTVVQNCGVTCWFGCRDTETRQVVSDLAGTTEVISHSRNVAWGLADEEHPKVGDSKSQVNRPLIYPAEVGELTMGDRMIVFAEDCKYPILARRKKYTKVFSGYGENPYYNRKGLFDWLS